MCETSDESKRWEIFCVEGQQVKEKLRLVERYLETIELDVLSGISVKEQKELKSILLRVWTTISKKEK
ncbi:hypothetical protein [Heyndrickxia vini]|uniref:Transcriptional regulator n=1 Tax=Heyndrickxia vini TaxID=1476025 RepID=A0ABX7E2Y5_9BACI|nr:hypothetical protein [Heyndrickxia vini]QQZ09635.1 hypothetical protein I5776_01205 [Heyndrickxia vini]